MPLEFTVAVAFDRQDLAKSVVESLNGNDPEDPAVRASRQNEKNKLSSPQDLTLYRSQCKCPCHNNPAMMHFRACCKPDPVKIEYEAVSEEEGKRLVAEEGLVELKVFPVLGGIEQSQLK